MTQFKLVTITEKNHIGLLVSTKQYAVTVEKLQDFVELYICASAAKEAIETDSHTSDLSASGGFLDIKISEISVVQ